MTFNEGGQFEGGRVRTRRGGAVAGGGIGIGAIAAFLIYQFTGVDLSPVLSGAGGGGGTSQEQEGTVADCTAEEANADRECRLSATVQSLDAYWVGVFDASQSQFVQPEVYSFTGGTSTGCGQASSSTGPFYCPPDQGIYMDLGFFDLLQSRFGASGGPLAEMYVTAHEYGHHIQNITGVMERADRGGSGAESDSVRVELQADCYAGMWAGSAATTVDPDTGTTFLEPITEAQLADALSAAAAVGDDHIQEQSGGSVDPHTWTHGSSEQRQRWFMTGYTEGTPQACDTFAAAEL
ncbi:neutral zinc metallopeptidase [Actinotalea sp. Marseille-Q4924]|uniref:KPN_02809 family neutral zinc metallopeptidase n=1 Tax=Actinotalea sp. Marseille-Q4924 TaxID=2866571 RepID=UPI001CE3EBAB|nr:neutral zinc metallopeptidase [Actinotalea sp. Marseille-Q4924]